MKVATTFVKCPICGESKYIEKLGKIMIAGLDPLMERFKCNHEFTKFEGEAFTPSEKMITWKCNTEFYVAPSIKYSEINQ